MEKSLTNIKLAFYMKTYSTWSFAQQLTHTHTETEDKETKFVDLRRQAFGEKAEKPLGANKRNIELQCIQMSDYPVLILSSMYQKTTELVKNLYSCQGQTSQKDLKKAPWTFLG